MADSTQPAPAYAAAHFALELDNKQQVGLFHSIEGGGVRADVMTYQNGSNYDRWRQLGKPKFEDIKLQVGMSMTKPFYDWLAKFFDGVAERKNGAIVAADYYLNERARREFKEAMITELTFPKLEKVESGAGNAYMSIGLAVEDIAFKKGGEKIQQSQGMDTQRVWTTSNFRFSLDGFEQACLQATKVDAFTIKQSVLEYHAGGHRAPIKTPSQVEFPQLSFYVPEADAQPFFDHFTAKAIKGEVRGDGTKRSGMVQMFDNDRRDLFTVEFFEAEIVNVQPDKADAGTDTIKLVKIDLFTERMAFTYAATQAA